MKWIVLVFVFCVSSSSFASIQQASTVNEASLDRSPAEPSAANIPDDAFASRGPVLGVQMAHPLNIAVGVGWVFGTRESTAASWGAISRGILLESN